MSAVGISEGEPRFQGRFLRRDRAREKQRKGSLGNEGLESLHNETTLGKFLPPLPIKPEIVTNNRGRVPNYVICGPKQSEMGILLWDTLLF